jgi:ATP-binding cassette subfamily C (CFTR/MRP) protein 1
MWFIIQALTMDNQARKESTVGEVVNLMSVDAKHLEEMLSYLWALWSSPLQIAVSLYLLYNTLGYAMFAG